MSSGFVFSLRFENWYTEGRFWWEPFCWRWYFYQTQPSVIQHPNQVTESKHVSVWNSCLKTATFMLCPQTHLLPFGTNSCPRMERETAYEFVTTFLRLHKQCMKSNPPFPSSWRSVMSTEWKHLSLSFFSVFHV